MGIASQDMAKDIRKRAIHVGEKGLRTWTEAATAAEEREAQIMFFPLRRSGTMTTLMFVTDYHPNGQD